MPITTITPNQGLNLDDAYSNIPNGSFVGAENVKIKSDGTSNGWVLQNIEGNEFKFTIPNLTPQNKKWILKQGVDSLTDPYILTLYDAYNNVLATASSLTWGGGGGVLALFDAALGVAGITFVTVTSSETTYEFTSIPYYDYKLESSGNPLTYIYLVQEAIDDAETVSTRTNMKRVIGCSEGTGNGSADEPYYGGVYVFTTNIAVQRPSLGSVNIPAGSVVSSGGGTPKVRINSASGMPYGLVAGDCYRVRITLSDNSQPTYKGVHIAEVGVAAAYIILLDVDWVGVITGTLQVESYISNYGELGFINYPYLDDSYAQQSMAYTKIWSTTQWDFTILNPIDSRTEPSALGYDQIYWGSLQEYYRCFYLSPNQSSIANLVSEGYSYDFATFGNNLVPFKHVLRSGNYDYESISVETRLQIPNTSKVEYLSQSTSGGGILAGNWRYMVSFLTSEGGAETNLSDITNPINVYSYNTNANFFFVYGEHSTVVTPKINNLQVVDYPLGVYQYVVLYGIHYADGATIVYRIKQQLIDNGIDIINISHYGTETYEIVAFNELRFNNELYKGQNIEIIDNRILASNLIKEGNPDLTAFALTIRHNIQYEELANGGEYKNPDNVNGDVGCMVNEDYVYAVQFELWSGQVTDQVYYIDTIRIDGDLLNNAGNPDPLDNRRVAGGTADMRIATASGVRKIFPQFLIDWDGNAYPDTLIDGQIARDVIKSVKIWRSEVINPRVVACGLAVPCVRTPAGLVGGLLLPSSPVSAAPYPDDIFPFPEFAGDTRGSAVTTYPSIYRSEWNGGTEQNFAFYTPDYYFTGDSFTYQTGDLFVLTSGITGTQQFVNTPAAAFESGYIQYYGDQTYDLFEDLTALPPIAANPDNPYTVSAARYCPTGSLVECGSASLKTFHNMMYIGTDVEDNQFQTYDCHVITLETNNDIALTYAVPTAAYGYYIRPRDNQYGDVNLLKYNYTGCYQNSDDVAPLTLAPLKINNGNDTFNQLSALKQRVKLNTDAVNEWNAQGTAFYTQNRKNTQMRVRITGSTNFYNSTERIEEWLCNVDAEAVDYNQGYSIYGNNYVKTLTPFDPALPVITNYGSRAIYTPQKPAGSLYDDYRSFPPLNFSDFPISQGSITDIKSANRKLIVIQPLKISHKYFNSEGVFSTVSGDNVVLGENSVMSRREYDLSSFGSRHKQSVKVGRTESGRDTVYWVCSDYKKIMRHGEDGTVCISDRGRIKSWCEQFIINDFNTTTNSIQGVGISAGWNQKDKEYIVTFRSISPIDSAVIDGKTISYNEYTNRFVSFYTAYPTIYIPFRDAYLTADSRDYNHFPFTGDVTSEKTGDIYLHNDDVVVNAFKPTYYGTFVSFSTASVVVNADVLNNKMFQNFEVDYEGGTPATYGAFTDMAFDTKTQTVSSYSWVAELALDYLRGQIPLEAVTEKPLSGIWLKATFYFDAESIAKLLRYTVKYIQSHRLVNR